MNNVFFFSSRRRHTRSKRDWSSDVCSSDLTDERQRMNNRPLLQPAQAGNKSAVRALVGVTLVHHTTCNWRSVDSQKIGRASCRERVLMVVVNVTVNK